MLVLVINMVIGLIISLVTLVINLSGNWIDNQTTVVRCTTIITT